MNVEPYEDGVACAGPTAPDCDRIDDLLRLLVTIRERWGNTAVRYRFQWGAAALWAEDGQKKELAKLKAKIERLKRKAAKANGVPS
jgi:hypothetical protein